MRHQSRANRIAFRRAVWASVALHVFAAGMLLLLLRSGDERRPLQASVDTRAANEPQVRTYFVEEAPVSAEVQPQPSSQPPSVQPQLPTEPPPSLPPKPFAPPAPRMLPPEMVALIRKPAPQPVPIGASNPSVTDPNVKPVSAGTSTGGAETSAPAIHGALKPEQVVVYILDCSGSMGAAGKFDAARAALLATLRQQPATVRFQVIIYAGAAVPLLASDSKGLPATDANIRAAAEKLAALEARGKSQHLEALRAAIAFRPDVILLLTDADDLNPAAVKRVLAGAHEPTTVCVGQVTAEGVQRPRELR